jgi:hypothetical protein
MDVICFLYVSLDSSTVQLHGSIGSRHACTSSEAGFSSQSGDRAWGVYYRRTELFVCFTKQKDSVRSINTNKYFLFTVGSVCPLKRFTAVSRNATNVRWWRRSWNGGAEVAKTTVKRLLCFGFRRTGKAMGQVYQCWWRICREIKVFLRVRISHVLCHIPNVTYLLTLPRRIVKRWYFVASR